MSRYVCIHGHFYQPPRENPWTGLIETEPSAAPHTNWNSRIAAECYAPNAAARILDPAGHLQGTMNNYSRMSFNFGPTLLDWMSKHDEATYRTILKADAESRQRFSGHGSALAQSYGHVILPLANRRDKRTQVIWGIRDFEQRFGRKPGGLWLPETAVDLETLEVLADAGIAFTVLSPTQASRVRPVGSPGWQSLAEGSIDPRRAYVQTLSGGRRIALFFYNPTIASGVAFGGLLHDGASFARALESTLDPAETGPQLAHVATDGESYGHHHRFGEMALAHVLNRFDRPGPVTLTNYGEFLERHPPTWEVEIRERTAWSCSHGLGRWTRHCGCQAGSPPEWSQEWRTPLRRAFDRLRDEVDPAFERAAGELLHDPWAARDDYILFFRDGSASAGIPFEKKHARHPLTVAETARVFDLLELQRAALLMYTSCGWFFDDVGGLEATQVLRYAAKVVRLARRTLDVDPEPELLTMLSWARSNRPEVGDAATIYRTIAASAPSS